MRITVFCLAALLASVVPGIAQTFGEITGEIRDSSGGVVADAVVTVTNQATTGARTSNANQLGV